MSSIVSNPLPVMPATLRAVSASAGWSNPSMSSAINPCVAKATMR